MNTKLQSITHKLLAGGLLLVSLTGCKVMYTPTMQNVPLLQEQGDIKVTLNTNNLQGAYALTENVGVMVNGSFHSSEWKVEDGMNSNEVYSSRRFNVEGAGGYFKKLGENGSFEVYGGAGYGNVSYNNTFSYYNPDINLDETQNLKFSANAMKVFVQPSIGTVGENLEVAFSTRLVALKFSGINRVGYTDEQLQMENIYQIDKPTYMFAEPALTLRYGLPWVKIQSQLLYSAKLNADALNYKPVNLNFSLHFNLSNTNRSNLFN